MFLSIINEGGPTFMYPLVILIIVNIALTIKGFIGKSNVQKTIKLLSSVSLFAIVWGLLGQVIGLIGAFDAIEAVGDISPALLAGGLKVSFIVPMFGFITFLIGRIGIILLTWLRTE